MLQLRDGKPGQGKSYLAVTLDILPRLIEGGYVATNIEMRPEGIAKLMLDRYGKVFDPSRLQILNRQTAPLFFEHVPAGEEGSNVLVVLDEVHKFFNARDFKQSDSKFRQTFERATEHRHFHLDIILISQDIRNIDAQLVRLSQQRMRVRNLRTWHIPKIPWLRIPYFDFLAVVCGDDNKTVMRRHWVKFDKLIGACYNTHSVDSGEGMKSSTGRVKLEVNPEVQKKLQKAKTVAKVMALLMLLIVAGIVGNWWAGYRWRKAAKQESKEQTAVQRVQAHLQPPVNIIRPGAAVISPSSKPEKYVDRLPKVEVIKVHNAIQHGRTWSVSVELDGGIQWLEPGRWCTRGRVGNIEKLELWGKLYRIHIHDDSGDTITLTGLQKATESPMGGGYPAQAGSTAHTQPQQQPWNSSQSALQSVLLPHSQEKPSGGSSNSSPSPQTFPNPNGDDN